MPLQPKFFTLLKNRPQEFGRGHLLREALAGLTVAFIAVPLSIALAIASGVGPERGLVTVVTAGFIVSLLGGSRVQIGGPTGAFVVIVAGIVQRYGVDGLIASTMMAGVFLVLMGLFKFGRMIQYIPYPITTGFTSGIAVVLFSTQVNDFFGMGLKDVPSDFVAKWGLYFDSLHAVSPGTLALGAFALFILAFWPKRFRFFPPPLAAIVVTTLAAALGGLEVETIGSRFGALPSVFPAPQMPRLSWQDFTTLIPPAVTIALLAGIESLLSAVVADGMIGKKHRSNMELVAQGLGNMASAAFGGIPATGAIARTAASVSSGARLPVAGMVHAAAVLLIMLAFSAHISRIPMTTLAAILFAVAYRMSEWRSFVGLFRAPKDDIAVLLVTFLLTVFIDLVAAIKIGMVLAALLFMKRMADMTTVINVEDDPPDETGGDRYSLDGRTVPPGVLVYEINGPFFFGAANSFLESLEKMKECRVLILRMRNVPVMDASGYHALYKVYRRCARAGTALLLSHVQRQPHSVMNSHGFTDLLGRDHFCLNIDTALKKAEQIVARAP
jgi:SulP family sulfate permease